MALCALPAAFLIMAAPYLADHGIGRLLLSAPAIRYTWSVRFLIRHCIDLWRPNAFRLFRGLLSRPRRW